MLNAPDACLRRWHEAQGWLPRLSVERLTGNGYPERAGCDDSTEREPPFEHAIRSGLRRKPDSASDRLPRSIRHRERPCAGMPMSARTARPARRAHQQVLVTALL